MAAPFGQTIRSLEADQGYGARVALALFGLLLAVWLVWLFAASFAAWLISETDQIQLSDIITVTFAGEGIDKLQPGQPALLVLDAPPLAEKLQLPAQVVGVTISNGKALVDIRPDYSRLEAQDEVGPEILAAFARPTPGHVQVEVERLSPAILVLRAAGLTVTTEPVYVNR